MQKDRYRMYLVFSNGYYVDIIGGGIYGSDNIKIAQLDPRERKILSLLIENPNKYTSREELEAALGLSPENAHQNVIKRVSSLKTKIINNCGHLSFDFIRTSAAPKVGGYGLFLNDDIILSYTTTFTKTEDTLYENPERALERKRINALADEASSDSKLGKYDKALKKRTEVYQWRQEHLGKEHEETIRAMANLATSYSKLKMHDKALELRRTVFNIREKSCDPSDDRLRKAKKNLAVSLNQIGGIDNLLEAKKLRKEISDMLGTDEQH